MKIKTDSLIDRIDDQIEARRLLSHPFYLAWTRGELTLDALRDYARQYYHHVAAFPTYLSALHSRSDSAGTRRHILQNLIDEEAGRPNHPELWLAFAECLGVEPGETQNCHPWAETKQLIETFRTICGNGDTAMGLAALYAYESQIPAIAEAKIDGLRKFYGIEDARGLAYFRVHIEADRRHAAVERGLLESYVNADNNSAVSGAVDSVLDALWGLLSAVGKRHGIDCP